METHTLLKDWPVKTGVMIFKGTEVQLQEPYISQMRKAKMIAPAKADEPKANKTSDL